MEDPTNGGLNSKNFYYITQLEDHGEGSFGSALGNYFSFRIVFSALQFLSLSLLYKLNMHERDRPLNGHKMTGAFQISQVDDNIQLTTGVFPPFSSFY